MGQIKLQSQLFEKIFITKLFFIARDYCAILIYDHFEDFNPV